jgi:prephenate dehydratase
VIRATAEGHVDLGIVPIENTIEGSVKDSVDMLVHEVELPIQAEWIYPSLQNLIGYRSEYAIDSNGNLDFTRVQKVLSKDVAIGQCTTFLKACMPQSELEFSASTSEGVRLVKANPGKGWTAIGTKLSAKLHGLDVLADHIMDHDNNYTRFIVVGHEPPALPPSSDVKTTLLITLPEDYPGALHQVLSAFAWRKINLTRIESRPTRMKLGSYYFYIDVEGSLNSVLIPAAIKEIEAIGCQVRMLGSYPCYPHPQQS